MGSKVPLSAKLKKGLELLLSIPKSFYASWRLTSYKKAWTLPVLCRHNCKLVSVNGSIYGGGRIKIGFNQTGLFDERTQRAIINISGNIELHGIFELGAGSRLEVGNNGFLIIKGNVANSAGLTISCHDRIVLEAGTVISWDTLILDRDFHYILDTNTYKTKSDHKPIFIGKNVWVCAGAKVLKGAVIPDGCIISAASVINRPFEENNCLLQGNPAMIVRRNVTRSDILL